MNKFVTQLEPDMDLGCWVWRGRMNQKGYSLISVGNHEWLAHRYSFGSKRWTMFVAGPSVCVRIT